FMITTGVSEEEFGHWGPIALYVGGPGEVRFKDIAYKDFQPKKHTPEQTSPHFRKQKLNNFYLSWGPAIADINRDGTPDIVAGPYYYLGPDYLTAKEIYPAVTLNPSTDFFNGVQFAYDFTGDGWPDVLNLQLGKPAVLYVNPKGESRRWQAYDVLSGNTCETWLLKDINGDGKPELIYKDIKNQVAWAAPDPRNPTGPWIEHAISEPGPWPNHGLGVGDINGDGRMDVVDAYGWWEQPKEGADKGPWKYHPQAFSDWNRTAQGGAEMAIYDVNGDGLNDVVTSLHAHGWGLAWFEQKRDARGEISFIEHKVMGDFSSNNAGGVVFSELHGSALADIDGDGIPDFITGKRYWSHLDGTLDPDPYGAPVLYIFRTVRNPKAPGGAELVPELVNNASGVGSSLAIADLNGDGAPEIITSTRFGTDIFWNNWKKGKTPSPGKR
ncbi:MAG: VCBS repeat-containing protein, partial [Acidobacteria bacterium]|nr:VCBS repeat-containing protein [Acidobacteriota bacterium]